MCGWICGWMCGWMYRWMYPSIDGYFDGLMDGGMYAWMHACMNRYNINFCIYADDIISYPTLQFTGNNTSSLTNLANKIRN